MRRRASAMLCVAKALLSDDPDAAHRLAARAVRLLSTSAVAPHEVALDVAPLDPDRAYRIADALGEGDRDRTLAGISRSLAKDEPKQAQYFADAVRDEEMRNNALQDLAKSVVRQDPDLAERIAHRLPEPSSRASALVDVAKAVAKADFAREGSSLAARS